MKPFSLYVLKSPCGCLRDDDDVDEFGIKGNDGCTDSRQFSGRAKSKVPAHSLSADHSDNKESYIV